MPTSSSWLFSLPPIERLMEITYNPIRETLLGALRQGPVPQHVAFVMDGNRRYARGLKREVIEGHHAGFETLGRVLEICYKIGVKVVTVYAFSIENFKRTKYEVDGLMEMAKTRLLQLAEHEDLLQRYGAKVQVIGKLEVLRPDVLEAINKMMKLTEHNNRAILNIAGPYTSREEMATAIRNTVDEYCQPIRPPLKRPFSETHITRNLQAQRIESGTVQPLQSMPSSDSLDKSTASTDSLTYTPNSPETKKLFQKFTARLSKILNTDQASLETGDITAAVNSALFILKHGLVNEDEKRKDTIEVMNKQITGPDLKFLQDVADALVDYPPDSSFPSDVTTLNPSSEGPTSHPSSSRYRDVEQIDEATITSHTYMGLDIPPVDILVRTSGVERFSDFLLWQCHEKTDVVFVKCLWPEFNLRHLIPIILEWQWRTKREAYWQET